MLILGVDVYDSSIAEVLNSELYDQDDVDSLITEFEACTIENVPFMAINIYDSFKSSAGIESTIYAATKDRVRTIRWIAENRALPLYEDSPSPFFSDSKTQSQYVDYDNQKLNLDSFKLLQALASDSGVSWSLRLGKNSSISDSSDEMPSTPYGMILDYIKKNEVGYQTLESLPGSILFDFSGELYKGPSMYRGLKGCLYSIKFSEKPTYRNLYGVGADIDGLRLVAGSVIRKRSASKRCIAWDHIAKVHWIKDRKGYMVETEYFQILFTDLPESPPMKAFHDSRAVYIYLMYWSSFARWLVGYPSRPSFNSPVDSNELVSHSMLDVYKDGFPLVMTL